MVYQISLDQLERRAAFAMDFAASINRPLTGPERDSLRWLLVASKSKAITSAVSRLKVADRSSHVRMIARLEKIINPDPVDVLRQLESTTRTFLDFAKSLERPLLKSERHAWSWILTEWDCRAIRPALVKLLNGRQADVYELVAQLMQVISPDPVRQTHLRREKPEVVLELNPGNFSVKTIPFKGVSIRRMTANEATERIALMARMANDIGTIARELTLVRNRDRPEAMRMARLGRLMVKLNREFVARSAAIPDEKSLEEIMQEMRAIGELMARG